MTGERAKRAARRRTMWLTGATWAEMAKREQVAAPAIVQQAKRRGWAANAPATNGYKLTGATRARLKTAMAAFRRRRLECETAGVPREQLDALEPFIRDPGEPDPRPGLTEGQTAALMRLADAHDEVLRVLQGGE